jgi:F-type H+-transporting ATPase subunit delta
MIMARIYAEAFFGYAAPAIGMEKALEELLSVKRVLKEDPEMGGFLENPAIMKSEKIAVIDKIFAGKISDQTRDFISLLLKKDRMDIFSDVAEYSRIKYSHGKEVDAVVSASYPLDLDKLESLKVVLEKKLKRKLHFYSDLDPALLGGVKVTVENTVIDGSVKKRLEDMREKLLSARMD